MPAEGREGLGFARGLFPASFTGKMKVRGVIFFLGAAWLGGTCGKGAEIAIPAEWLRAAPGPKEAALIEQGAGRHGWPAMAEALRGGALDAYGKGNLAAAESWGAAARWAERWGATEAAEDARWRAAMEAEGWPGGREVAETDRRTEGSATADRGTGDRGGEGRAIGGGSRSNEPILAERMPAALRLRLLADAAFSAEYFALEKPVDRRAEAFGILARLFARDAKAFERFGGLALAIALVHDVPPPGDWPHWQVSPAVLPRRLAPAEEVFDTFAGRGAEAAGPGLWQADKLDAAELRFLVDLALPAEERAWARTKVRAPLPKLAETYSSIKYRTDRIEENAYVWPGDRYRLEDILREGGICVDQAYFASQAGKARGVPTLLFAGAGRDGRHAWFGFLGVGRKWVMDAGRYEEQNYVTGVAHDPQTWTEISDHELKFLSEGFRRERNAREARVHAWFARWLREAGRAREAEAAARAATRLERRTVEAWEELLVLRPEAGEAREAVAREAAGGLTSYPELQARFTGVAVESLRARGETAEADRLGRELARRFAGKRGDLSTKEIAGQLARAMTSETPEEQMRLYRSLLRQFGRGAGAGMWDEVVRPFVGALAVGGRWKEARAALALARETLAGGYGSQIDEEMRAMDAELARGARAAAGK